MTIIKDLGIHKVIEYNTDDKIKTIKTIKKYSIPVKKYESVTKRQNTWVKFGKATCDDNEKVTFRSTEDIFMEPPSPPSVKTKKDDYMMKCRNCSSEHWTRLCPELNENKDSTTKVVENESKRENKAKENKTSFYEKKVYTESSKTTKTILIQNLSKDMKEFDIHELLSSTGCQIYKIFIPKDYQTGESRGMAFIDVKNEKEANAIISKYDNFGINYLRIKVSLVV